MLNSKASSTFKMPHREHDQEELQDSYDQLLEDMRANLEKSLVFEAELLYHPEPRDAQPRDRIP